MLIDTHAEVKLEVFIRRPVACADARAHRVAETAGKVDAHVLGTGLRLPVLQAVIAVAYLAGFAGVGDALILKEAPARVVELAAQLEVPTGAVAHADAVDVRQCLVKLDVVGARALAAQSAGEVLLQEPFEGHRTEAGRGLVTQPDAEAVLVAEGRNHDACAELGCGVLCLQPGAALVVEVRVNRDVTGAHRVDRVLRDAAAQAERDVVLVVYRCRSGDVERADAAVNRVVTLRAVGGTGVLRVVGEGVILVPNGAAAEGHEHREAAGEADGLGDLVLERGAEHRGGNHVKEARFARVRAAGVGGLGHFTGGVRVRPPVEAQAAERGRSINENIESFA